MTERARADHQGGNSRADLGVSYPNLLNTLNIVGRTLPDEILLEELRVSSRYPQSRNPVLDLWRGTIMRLEPKEKGVVNKFLNAAVKAGKEGGGIKTIGHVRHARSGELEEIFDIGSVGAKVLEEVFRQQS